MANSAEVSWNPNIEERTTASDGDSSLNANVWSCSTDPVTDKVDW